MENVELYYENVVAFCCNCINYRYSYYMYIGSDKIHKTLSILMHTKDKPNSSVGNRKGKSLSIIGKLLPIDYRLIIENPSIA